ncbi:uncharacterized protein LOC124930173 [Impatiens glandulifera]|uniref:uncharacterized protein LOC124930173 n=1 Tax=Impatiens glandulifera TaxID=253017 RepID=UPI001FB0B7B1|nr:uncharacterized protein LOC124930173 [Impatiens glandulifera]
MAGQTLKDWVHWLPLAEWWYNTNFHTAIQTTPFEAIYGYPPSVHTLYVVGDSRVEEVDVSLTTREASLQLIKQRSVQKLFHKLSPKYFGPFEVLERIGEVAYNMELGTEKRIHNVFHVSQLKSFQGTPAVVENIPQLSTQPNRTGKIVGEQDIMVQGKMKKQLLINWNGAQTEDQTWEDAEVISIQCPEMLAARRQTRQHSLSRGRRISDGGDDVTIHE